MGGLVNRSEEATRGRCSADLPHSRTLKRARSNSELPATKNAKVERAPEVDSSRRQSAQSLRAAETKNRLDRDAPEFPSVQNVSATHIHRHAATIRRPDASESLPIPKAKRGTAEIESPRASSPSDSANLHEVVRTRRAADLEITSSFRTCSTSPSLTANEGSGISDTEPTDRDYGASKKAQARPGAQSVDTGEVRAVLEPIQTVSGMRVFAMPFRQELLPADLTEEELKFNVQAQFECEQHMRSLCDDLTQQINWSQHMLKRFHDCKQGTIIEASVPENLADGKRNPRGSAYRVEGPNGPVLVAPHQYLVYAHGENIWSKPIFNTYPINSAGGTGLSKAIAICKSDPESLALVVNMQCVVPYPRPTIKIIWVESLSGPNTWPTFNKALCTVIDFRRPVSIPGNISFSKLARVRDGSARIVLDLRQQRIKKEDDQWCSAHPSLHPSATPAPDTGSQSISASQQAQCGSVRGPPSAATPDHSQAEVGAGLTDKPKAPSTITGPFDRLRMNNPSNTSSGTYGSNASGPSSASKREQRNPEAKTRAMFAKSTQRIQTAPGFASQPHGR